MTPLPDPLINISIGKRGKRKAMRSRYSFNLSDGRVITDLYGSLRRIRSQVAPRFGFITIAATQPATGTRQIAVRRGRHLDCRICDTLKSDLPNRVTH